MNNEIENEWNTEKQMRDSSEVCRLMADELDDALKMIEGNAADIEIGQATKDDIHRQRSTLYRAGLILLKRAEAHKRAAAEAEEDEQPSES
tara:strand:+ start:419 stop:691 length:273 start_codon:yes stop_codon:yes gene_type:complete